MVKDTIQPGVECFYQVGAKDARPFAFSEFLAGVILSCGASDLKTSVNQSWQEKTEL